MVSRDPGRRDRIVDAALDCIAADGVAGTSHRKVATRANVPLGSVPYYFATMDNLLFAAFTRVVDQLHQVLADRLRGAKTQDDAVNALVILIHSDLQRSRREHVLSYELYTLAARHERFLDLTQDWMRQSRDCLAGHFDDATVDQLDKYIEGASLHIALGASSSSPESTRRAILRLIHTSPNTTPQAKPRNFPK